MKLGLKVIKLAFFCLFLASCSSAKIIHLSSGFKVQKIAPSTYVATDLDFYTSNILVTQMSDGTVVIASSPFDSYGSRLLVNWIKEELKPTRMIAINTHFHRDGVAGNEVFHQENVETWASEKTVYLTKLEMKKPLTSMLKFVRKKELQERIKKTKLYPAENTFKPEAGKVFKFPNEEIEVYFPGHAHSPDNVVVYLKNKRILFGGCMIKPGKNLGYLGVANVEKWKGAMLRLKKFNPNIVVPGHGSWGGIKLLKRTQTNLISYLESLDKPL